MENKVHQDATFTHNRPYCQYCKNCPDHWNHILLCPQPIRREHFLQLVTELDKFLTCQDTEPFLQRSIIHGLKNLIQTADPSQAPDAAMYHNQSLVG